MHTKLILAMLLLAGYAIPSQATLIDRGDGMIYDDVLNITWLQNANMGGSMTWDSAVDWAAGLSFGGFDDWRLASMDVKGDHIATGSHGNGIVDCNTASELDCQDNELGYMYYYNLGGSGGSNGSTTSVDGITFSNVQFVHWSGTEYARNPDFVWDFNFFNGDQNTGAHNLSLAAWAVRQGDVLAAVPEPGTIGK